MELALAPVAFFLEKPRFAGFADTNTWAVKRFALPAHY
jgi:hypothetical protein